MPTETFFFKYKHASLTDHILELERLGENSNDYFKCSIVRNPWDAAVSLYFHNRYENLDMAMGSFGEYLEKRLREPDFLDITPFLYHLGHYKMDYIIRFENYKNDAGEIFKKFGIQPPQSSKQHYNTLIRPENTPYREFYSEVYKERVQQKAKVLIDLFKYSF